MTAREQVRLLISDIGGESGTDFLFEDSEIDGFLELAHESVRQAAADALRAIASNEAQVQKRITFLELKTDGPAVAKALNELADKLEAKADKDETDEEDIEIAEMVLDPVSRERALYRYYGVPVL